MKKLVLYLVASFFLFSNSWSNATEKYLLHDLGTIGYDYSSASSINNHGVVVGYAGGFASKWENGQATVLPFIDSSSRGRASAINDKNEIAGHISSNDWWMRFGACIWLSNGEIEKAYHSGSAVDINNSSQALISDWYSVVSYLWQDGNLTRIISSEDGFEHHTPNAINDLGQVVGNAYMSGYSFGYLWENGQLFDINDLILNEFDSTLESALDINNSGQIIGSNFLYDNGYVTDIGFSGATAINDNSQIVGGNFIYENGQLFDLYNLIESNIEYIDLRAEDINNSGQIVGSANIDGSMHAVLLNPVPIPGAAWLFGSGLVGIVGIRKKLKK